MAFIPQLVVAAPAVVPSAPISPAEARSEYREPLNAYEMREVGDCNEIYYLGQPARKLYPSIPGGANYGFDDNEHHYRASTGDHIAYRYEIRSLLGKGAFGQVIRCYDHKTKSIVAVKMIVNTELMHEQGRIECSIVQHINKVDPSNSHHLIRGLDFFVFRCHICAVFEILGQNLYEYSRVMRFRPIQPRHVKPLARQLLEALAFCHEHSVVHCDIKPENVVIDVSGFPNIKLIDFGSSCFVGHQRYDSIQSRFYRAPEVILGIRSGRPMDIWSFACIAIELIIGKPIFPGGNGHEQLDLLMEVFGPMPEALKANCSRRKEFFTTDGRFVGVKGRRGRRPGSVSLEIATHITDSMFLDLLAKCFEWKQEDRISAADALNHPWFQAKEEAGGRPTVSHILPELIR
jgi:dual specificity tyrosine-phosphorylation-regulated kinase 2/3/4